MPIVEDFRHLAPQIILSSSEAIVASDFDGNVIYWNPAAERLYGWRTDEVLGRNIFTVMAHVPTIDRTRDTLASMRTRESWTREVTIVRKDGTRFSGEITLSQLKDDDGNIIGIVGVTSDISERRHAEQRLNLLYSITRLLAGTNDVPPVATDVLKVICQEIEWDWGALWLVDDSGESMICAATWDNGSGPYATFSRAAYDIQFTPGLGIIGHVWSSGEPEWVVDYPSDPRALRGQSGRDTGICSAMQVPVRSASGQVIGVIEIMTHDRSEPNEPLLEMVSAAARQLGLFIERQTASKSLVENESRLRRLEESDLLGIIRAGLDGTIVSANDAFLHMTGYERQDLEAGLRWDAMTPQEWQAVDYEIINDVLNTGRSEQREKEYIRKDGSRIAVLVGAARLNEDGNEVIAFVVDVSAWKQAEREREESLARESAAREAAHDAQGKAEQLLGVTAAFSRARTQDEIARVTIDEGMAVMGATGCSFTLVNDAGDALELLAAVGYGPGTLDGWKARPLPLSSGFPITECVLRAEPIWVRSREELFQRFPVARDVTFPYSASIAAIPLISNSRPVGAINLGFELERDFSESERVFIETLVQFCSQALERAWIFEREQRARKSADAAQRRAEQLLNITAALSRAAMPDEVASVVIDQGLSALGVHGGVIAVLNDDGTALQVLHSRGYPADSVELWKQPLPLERHVPMTDAIKRNEPVWVTSRQELFERYPVLISVGVEAEAVVALPLTVGNRVYGVLGLQYRHAEELDQAERVFARTLARLSSQALERAQLFEMERSARLSAETSQHRLRLLANAGELLTSSLDTNVTLDLVARVLVPEIADWCAIDVLDANGLPDRVSVIHIDPEKIRLAEDLQRRYPFDPDSPTGLAHVLRTGSPEMYPYITEEMITAAARDLEQLEIIRQVGFQSAMIVPMIARGRTVGAITLVHAESGRHYTEEDLALVEDLAYRAALAIDNARLFEDSQSHARRMDAIAEASRLFAEAGHDIDAVVGSLAEHMTRHIGDWSVVRLISDDGVWLNPVAIHHSDSEARAALDQMFMQDPLRTNEGMTGSVASTGEALMISTIDPEMLRKRIKPEYRRWMDRYAMYAVLIVPMRRRNQVVGTIAMFRGTPDSPYTDEDRLFAQNIADRAALALENAQLFHQAQEAVRLREEFLSIASHEMRTPLTTITGFTHLLNRQVSRGQLDPGRVEAITGSLLTEATRLNQLVGDLLDVSRIQQGRLDIRPERCNLSAIVHAVVDRLKETYERSADREIVVDAPPEVEGVWDGTRIDQVVTNLLTNALKYSVDGEITLSVWTEHGDTAMLAVSDRGIGIPEDQQDRLFEPFVRGNDAHYRASGTGLGLYITRQIVQHHGGVIELQSEPGQGTTFTVRLPMEVTINAGEDDQ